MEDCLFCKIARGDIPSDKVYEDERMLCFKDIDPKAPVHVLIIPKEHVSSLNELSSAHIQTVSAILLKIKELAKELNVDKSGYRVVINTGADGGQTVDHLHFHLLGARAIGWPPG